MGRSLPSGPFVNDSEGIEVAMSERSYFTRGAGMMPWTEEGPERETSVRATVRRMLRRVWM